METIEQTGGAKTPEQPKQTYTSFALRALIAVSIAAFVTICVFLLWCIIRVLVLIFFAILISTFLRGISNWLTYWSKLPERVSLTLVILVLCGVIGISAWMLVPHVSEQVDKLAVELPRSLHQAQSYLGKYTGQIQTIGQGKGLSQLFEGIGSYKRLETFFSLTLQTVADAVIVFFLILYLAYSPGRYVDGVISLVPKHYRPRAREIVQTLGLTLQWWLIGRFSTMTIVGVLSGIGLWLLGIPLALTLGVLAGLFTFIPYVGAIVSAVPAILMALLVDVSHVLYVVLLYLGIHTVEGYILSPLIQERTVYIPPMLMLAALTAMTILLGIPGLIIATPLTATVLVLIKKTYIEDILGESADSREQIGQTE